MIKLKNIILENFNTNDYSISKQEEQFAYNFLIKRALPRFISDWNRIYYYIKDEIEDREDRLFYLPEVLKNFKKIKHAKNIPHTIDYIIYKYSKNITPNIQKTIKISLGKDSNPEHRLIYSFDMKINRTSMRHQGVEVIGNENIELP